MIDRALTARPLRLRAVDAEDLAILSAQLQDALVPIADMAYLPDQGQFVMVVNRFMWNVPPADHAEPGAAASGPGSTGQAIRATEDPSYLRIHCGVRFDGVTAVRSRGFDLKDRRLILELLAVRPEEGAVSLDFAGGAQVRLETGAVDCFLADLGDPWPTRLRPSHPIEPRDGPEPAGA